MYNTNDWLERLRKGKIIANYGLVVYPKVIHSKVVVFLWSILELIEMKVIKYVAGRQTRTGDSGSLAA